MAVCVAAHTPAVCGCVGIVEVNGGRLRGCLQVRRVFQKHMQEALGSVVQRLSKEASLETYDIESVLRSYHVRRATAKRVGGRRVWCQTSVACSFALCAHACRCFSFGSNDKIVMLVVLVGCIVLALMACGLCPVHMDGFRTLVLTSISWDCFANALPPHRFAQCY